MDPPPRPPSGRFRLRVQIFPPADSHNLAAPPQRQFVLAKNDALPLPDLTLRELCDEIVKRFGAQYPGEELFSVDGAQDAFGSDLYLGDRVRDVFEDNEIFRVVRGATWRQSVEPFRARSVSVQPEIQTQIQRQRQQSVLSNANTGLGVAGVAGRKRQMGSPTAWTGAGAAQKRQRTASAAVDPNRPMRSVERDTALRATVRRASGVTAASSQTAFTKEIQDSQEAVRSQHSVQTQNSTTMVPPPRPRSRASSTRKSLPATSRSLRQSGSFLDLLPDSFEHAGTPQKPASDASSAATRDEAVFSDQQNQNRNCAASVTRMKIVFMEELNNPERGASVSTAQTTPVVAEAPVISSLQLPLASSQPSPGSAPDSAKKLKRPSEGAKVAASKIQLQPKTAQARQRTDVYEDFEDATTSSAAQQPAIGRSTRIVPPTKAIASASQPTANGTVEESDDAESDHDDNSEKENLRQRETERLVSQAEEKQRLEWEKEEAEAEAARKAREEQEQRAREEAETKAREEEEKQRKIHEQEEMDRRAREEEAELARLEAERLAREAREAEDRARTEAEAEAEAEAAKAAEAARLESERLDRQRRLDEEAAARREREAEVKRKRDADAKAKAERKAAEAAEQKRKKEAEMAAAAQAAAAAEAAAKRQSAAAAAEKRLQEARAKADAEAEAKRQVEKERLRLGVEEKQRELERRRIEMEKEEVDRAEAEKARKLKQGAEMNGNIPETAKQREARRKAEAKRNGRVATTPKTPKGEGMLARAVAAHDQGTPTATPIQPPAPIPSLRRTSTASSGPAGRNKTPSFTSSTAPIPRGREASVQIVDAPRGSSHATSSTPVNGILKRGSTSESRILPPGSQPSARRISFANEPESITPGLRRESSAGKKQAALVPLPKPTPTQTKRRTSSAGSTSSSGNKGQAKAGVQPSPAQLGLRLPDHPSSDAIVIDGDEESGEDEEEEEEEVYKSVKYQYHRPAAPSFFDEPGRDEDVEMADAPEERKPADRRMSSSSATSARRGSVIMAPPERRASVVSARMTTPPSGQAQAASERHPMSSSPLQRKASVSTAATANSVPSTPMHSQPITVSSVPPRESAARTKTPTPVSPVRSQALAAAAAAVSPGMEQVQVPSSQYSPRTHEPAKEKVEKEESTSSDEESDGEEEEGDNDRMADTLNALSGSQVGTIGKHVVTKPAESEQERQNEVAQKDDDVEMEDAETVSDSPSGTEEESGSEKNVEDDNEDDLPTPKQSKPTAASSQQRALPQALEESKASAYEPSTAPEDSDSDSDEEDNDKTPEPKLPETRQSADDGGSDSTQLELDRQLSSDHPGPADTEKRLSSPSLPILPPARQSSQAPKASQVAATPKATPSQQAKSKGARTQPASSSQATKQAPSSSLPLHPTDYRPSPSSQVHGPKSSQRAPKPSQNLPTLPSLRRNLEQQRQRSSLRGSEVRTLIQQSRPGPHPQAEAEEPSETEESDASSTSSSSSEESDGEGDEGEKDGIRDELSRKIAEIGGSSRGGTPVSSTQGTRGTAVGGGGGMSGPGGGKKETRILPPTMGRTSLGGSTKGEKSAKKVGFGSLARQFLGGSSRNSLGGR